MRRRGRKRERGPRPRAQAPPATQAGRQLTGSGLGAFAGSNSELLLRCSSRPLGGGAAGGSSEEEVGWPSTVDAETHTGMGASPRQDLLGSIAFGIDAGKQGRSREGDRPKAWLPVAVVGFGWPHGMRREQQGGRQWNSKKVI